MQNRVRQQIKLLQTSEASSHPAQKQLNSVRHGCSVWISPTPHSKPAFVMKSIVRNLGTSNANLLSALLRQVNTLFHKFSTNWCRIRRLQGLKMLITQCHLVMKTDHITPLYVLNPAGYHTSPLNTVLISNC